MIAYRIYLFDTLIYDTISKENVGVISATLKMEINQPSTFHFEMLPVHPQSDVLASDQARRTLVAVQELYVDDEDVIQDSYWPFIGRVKSVSRQINKNLSVDCEDFFSFLNDCYIKYREGEYPTYNDVFIAAAEHYNTQLNTSQSGYVIAYNQGSSTGTDTPFILSSSYEEAWAAQTEEEEPSYEYIKCGDFISDKILSQNSAILMFLYDYTPDTKTINVQFAYIDGINPGLSYTRKATDQRFPTVETLLVPDALFETLPSFSTDHNILGLNKDTIKGDIYSGILAVGKNGATSGNVVWDEQLVKNYGYVAKAVSFSEIEDTTQLDEVAMEYLQKFAVDLGYKFTVEAAEPCEVFENVNYLARVGYIAALKDIDNSLWVSPFLSISLNLFEIENNEYVIGPYVPQCILNEEITAI